MYPLLILIGLLSVACLQVKCAPDEDLVTNLPGLPSPALFRHYSGYLNATTNNHLHYWFVESQSSTAPSDPVVVWLQGGPGCSSLTAFLTEHGPFRMNPDGKTLHFNEYSWNTVANVIYLESPAGTGYSYTDGGSQLTDDNQTAAQNLAAFKSFFEKFPEYADNEFFITGESYGGIYVPTVSALVLDDGSFNFKGFAIGNGMHDWYLDDKTSLINEGYHGLYSAKTLEDIFIYCCPAGTVRSCDFDLASDPCQKAIDDAYDAEFYEDFNPYYMYDVCPQVVSPFIAERLLYRYRKGHTKHQRNPNSKRVKRITDDTDCPGEIDIWPNLPEVRAALHIPDNVPEWYECGGPPYETIYTNNTSAFYKILLPKVRALLYNGDADTVCNYLHGQYFAEGLGLPVVEEYRAWNIDYLTRGFVKTYENLTFTTIMNAGHMVPTNKPEAALHLFKNFLNNLPL